MRLKKTILYSTILLIYLGCKEDKALEAKFSFQEDPKIGKEIELINESIGASYYIWDFGDGNKSVKKLPKHTYLKEGSYVVKLTVYDETKKKTKFLKKEITVKKSVISQPEQSFIDAPEIAIAGVPFVVTNLNSNYQLKNSLGEDSHKRKNKVVVNNPQTVVWQLFDGKTNKEEKQTQVISSPGYLKVDKQDVKTGDQVIFSSDTYPNASFLVNGNKKQLNSPIEVADTLIAELMGENNQLLDAYYLVAEPKTEQLICTMTLSKDSCEVGEAITIYVNSNVAYSVKIDALKIHGDTYTTDSPGNKNIILYNESSGKIAEQLTLTVYEKKIKRNYETMELLSNAINKIANDGLSYNEKKAIKYKIFKDMHNAGQSEIIWNGQSEKVENVLNDMIVQSSRYDKVSYTVREWELADNNQIVNFKLDKK